MRRQLTNGTPRFVRRSRSKRTRRGGTLVLLAFVLPVVVILGALAINLAYLELARTELYIASDAAARAAARELAKTGSQTASRAAARAAASRNMVVGKALQLSDADIAFGVSTRPSLAVRYNFNTAGTNPNAVEITANRTSAGLDGAIPMLMPNILGVATVDMQQTARATQLEVDLAIVLDRSGSMAYAADEPAVYPPVPAAAPVGWDFGQLVPPNSRWLDAVNAVNVFITELNNSAGSEMVALCSYNNTATIDVPLTSNYTLLPPAMDVYTQNYYSGKTGIGNGILKGIDALSSAAQRPWAIKVILVMTDGIQNVGYDAEDAAEDAADQGIMVFTVTFSEEADQDEMADVAAAGMGQHFHADSGSDLATVFQEIARYLPTLLTR